MGRKNIYKGIKAVNHTFKIFPWEKKKIKEVLKEDRDRRTKIVEEKGEDIIIEWLKDFN